MSDRELHTRRAEDVELAILAERYDALRADVDELQADKRHRDAAELAAARALVVEARASAADATAKAQALTAKDAALVLDERKEKRTRRWDLTKLTIPVVLSTAAGALAAYARHLWDLITHSRPH